MNGFATFEVLRHHSRQEGLMAQHMQKLCLGSSDASHRRRHRLSPAVLLVTLHYDAISGVHGRSFSSRLSRENTVLVDQAPSMQGRLRIEVDHRGFCHQFLRRFWLTHFSRSCAQPSPTRRSRPTHRGLLLKSAAIPCSPPSQRSLARNNAFHPRDLPQSAQFRWCRCCSRFGAR